MELVPGTRYVSEVSAEVLPAADVVVAGGGTAGVLAALSAARNGAKTVLVESRGYLGGMLTAGNAGITMFTKYSGRPADHAENMALLRTDPDQLHVVGGIAMELTRRLLDTGAGLGDGGVPGSYVFTSSEDFKRILVEMMEEAGVSLRLHSHLADVVRDGNRVLGVALESKSGRQVLPARQFVDATGDGDLAVRAGASFAVGVTEQDVCAKEAKIGKMSDSGVMFKVGNVDLPKTLAWLAEHPEHFCVQPFGRFSLEEVRERFARNENAVMVVTKLGRFPGGFQVYNLPTPGVVTLCCPLVPDVDGCDVQDLTRAETAMAKLLGRWMAGIRTVPGFENSFLLQVPEIGIRETRHIKGEYLMNLEDIYHQKPFDDCIGLGSHPVDTYPRPEWLLDATEAYPPRWHFQIPYRALVAADLANCLVAGRCISATHEAAGCIRTTVQCLITGEAAGAAAALAVRENRDPRQLDVAALRELLKRQGVKC